MTHALVVFESMFGNARTVAQAIAEGLRQSMTVELVEVGTAPTVIADAVTLLVVGGPTHMLALSRPASRERAARMGAGPLVSRSTGLREWLSQLQPRPGLAAAAFDTRLTHPRWLLWFDSAAPKIAKRLRALGLKLLVPPQNFFVAGERGPLSQGEVGRARDWGSELGQRHGSTGCAQGNSDSATMPALRGMRA